MATAVDELLDMLFDMIDEAKGTRLNSEKCVIDRDKALDLIEDIKAQFPVELAEARKVLNSRNEYVAAAKREAEEIRKRAEAEAGQKVNEAQVMSQARQRANQLIAQAEEKAKQVGGHGGMDFIMDYRLIYCLRNGLPLDMDVYDLAEWCCLIPLSEISLDNGSVPVEIPDFTRGGWNRYDQVEFAL